MEVLLPLVLPHHPRLLQQVLRDLAPDHCTHRGHRPHHHSVGSANVRDTTGFLGGVDTACQPREATLSSEYTLGREELRILQKADKLLWSELSVINDKGTTKPHNKRIKRKLVSRQNSGVLVVVVNTRHMNEMSQSNSSTTLVVMAVRQQNICCSPAPSTSHSESESGQTTLP